MKNKEKNGLKEIYKHFCENYKMYEKVVDYKTFRDVIKAFNKEIVRLLVEEGAEFKMPDRLGTIRLRKYKRRIEFNDEGRIKNLPVNWKMTWELWDREYPNVVRSEMKYIKGKPLVYHLNEHTDGYRIYLYWNKKGSNARNKGVYAFQFTSVNNRYLARVVQGDNKPEYYE